jgi:hypothetical protein
MKPCVSTMPVAGDHSAATQRSDAAQRRLQGLCLRGIEPLQRVVRSREAVGLGALGDLPQRVPLRGLCGDNQLAQALVGDAAFSAISIEHAAPFHAASRLERARRVVHAGVDDFAVTRRGAGADRVLALEHD